MYLGIQSETQAIFTVANSSAGLCNCFNDPKLLAKNALVWNHACGMRKGIWTNPITILSMKAESKESSAKQINKPNTSLTAAVLGNLWRCTTNQELWGAENI